MADHNAQAPSGPMGFPPTGESDTVVDLRGEDWDGPSSELVLDRIHHYRDTIRSYQIVMEGQKVGTIRDNRRTTLLVPPGRYVIRLQLLWIFSPRLEVSFDANQTVRLVCGPNGGILAAWRLFFAPTTAIFLRYPEAEH